MHSQVPWLVCGPQIATGFPIHQQGPGTVERHRVPPPTPRPVPSSGHWADMHHRAVNFSDHARSHVGTGGSGGGGRHHKASGATHAPAPVPAHATACRSGCAARGCPLEARIQPRRTTGRGGSNAGARGRTGGAEVQWGGVRGGGTCRKKSTHLRHTRAVSWEKQGACEKSPSPRTHTAATIVHTPG